jgi:phage terminase small subunit
MLGLKMQMFCAEFIIDLNPKKAAIRAGYAVGSATNTGSRLLARKDCASEVERLMVERASKTTITSDLVLQELSKVAFGSIGDLVHWGPQGVTLIDKGLLSKDAIGAVQEVSETVGSGGMLTTKIRRHDKLRALELVGKHLGMFKDTVKHEGSADAPLFVLPALPRQPEE